MKDQYYKPFGLLVSVVTMLIGGAALYQNQSQANPTTSQSIINQVTVNLPVPRPEESSSIYPSLDTQVESKPINNYITASLDIVGSNNSVMIKQAKTAIEARNVSIIGSNQSKMIYLPLGQRLEIGIKGSNNELIVEDSVIEQLTVHDNGANNRLEEL